MGAPYRTAIFDLDGTLLDTLDDLTSSTNAALSAHGLPERTRAEVRAFVGNGIYNLIRQAVPEGSTKELIADVHATFDEHYAAHNLVETAPYPGVCELVDRLKEQGIGCCVVSNKGDYAVQPLVRHFFGDRFAIAVGEREREGIRRKPWPDTVLACMGHLGSAPEDTVYVGDSEVDLRTAENAHIDCVIVSWGFREVAFLRSQGARTIVDTCEELERAITGAS